MDATALLAALVGMPTITDDIPANAMALDYLENYFAGRGMHCKRHVFDGHGALTASTRRDNHMQHTVLLSAHVDVVTGNDEQFSLREENGKLLGRGVYDMKFAIAGYMQLVDELQGSLEEYNFAIMITTDEEASQGYGHSGVAHLIKAGYRPGICLLPDSAAPGWDVEKLAKGWWRFDLIAKGKAAHGARPWEGESASIKLIHALHELKEHFKDHGPLTDSLNIGSIHGDGIYNQVPAHMMAKVEIRLADEAAAEKNKRLIETLCADHDITHNTYSLVQPVRAILDVPLAQTYMDVVQEITGRRPQGTISLAGSDAPYFTEAHIPCILSCPQGGGHHSEHEWLDKQSFLQFVPIVREFLERTARTAAASVDTAAQNGVK